MLTEDTAMRLVEQTQPGTTAKACVSYNGFFLVRVERSDPDEEHFDPFFSVDPIDREVRDFSVLEDIVTITDLFIAKEGGGDTWESGLS